RDRGFFRRWYWRIARSWNAPDRNWHGRYGECCERERKKESMSKHGSKHGDFNEELGDFTTTMRVIPIGITAAVIGFISAYVAWVLLRLIGFFTNVFYYGRTGTAMVSPAGNHLDRK